ncbi:hypothetical protein [Streptomyces sp. NPDC048272]|uniref:hypothetical protein n=1 Tax=Streptomyces sp. NPDC048272 TaxID=3154616 RepID=UPI00342A75BF
MRRRDAKESVTAIAARLGVGRSILYRTLAAYDEAVTPCQPMLVRVTEPPNWWEPAPEALRPTCQCAGSLRPRRRCRFPYARAIRQSALRSPRR